MATVLWMLLHLCSEFRDSCGSRGTNPAVAHPHRSRQWNLAPLGGRKSNDSIVNLSKCKEFGPSSIDVGNGFAPPYGKYHIKTLKRSMTKKGLQKIWEMTFLGKCWNFVGKRLKKVVQKFRGKFAPPVSEVLDPLVFRDVRLDMVVSWFRVLHF